MTPMKYLGLASVMFAAAGASVGWAASHREAPAIAMDATADNTDVYAFVSYDQDNLTGNPNNLRGFPDTRNFDSITDAKPGTTVVWETLKEKREVFNHPTGLPAWNLPVNYGPLRVGDTTQAAPAGRVRRCSREHQWHPSDFARLP